jgi:hypothetical protein
MPELTSEVSRDFAQSRFSRINRTGRGRPCADRCRNLLKTGNSSRESLRIAEAAIEYCVSTQRRAQHSESTGGQRKIATAEL